MGEWVTGGFVDRSGMNRYLHLQRSPDDPERMSREQRKGMLGDSAMTAWQGALRASTKPEWKEKILALLADDKERTFNAIVLEISGLEYTADVAFEKAPDHALWELVTERKLEHTMEVPTFFRRAQ